MKNKNLILGVVMFLLLSVSVCKAQDYHPGYVILNDGTRISGWVKLNEAEPWLNQRYVRIRDSAAIAADPNAKDKRIRTNDRARRKIRKNTGTRQDIQQHYAQPYQFRSKRKQTGR